MGPEEHEYVNDEDEDSNDEDEGSNDEPGITDEPFRDPDWDDPEDDVREPD
jgi:hypothetical protein